MPLAKLYNSITLYSLAWLRGMPGQLIMRSRPFVKNCSHPFIKHSIFHWYFLMILRSLQICIQVSQKNRGWQGHCLSSKCYSIPSHVSFLLFLHQCNCFELQQYMWCVELLGHDYGSRSLLKKWNQRKKEICVSWAIEFDLSNVKYNTLLETCKLW